MPQNTITQARGNINMMLSTAARGHSMPANIGSEIFPIVPVGQRGGLRLVFNKQHFVLQNSHRNPGENTKRRTFTYDNSTYAVKQRRREASVPRELMQESQAIPDFDQQTTAVEGEMGGIMLELEKEQLDLAQDEANYAASNKSTLSGTDQWDDDASDIVQQFQDAKATVRSKIGVNPNKAVISDPMHKRLQNHPQIIERIKYAKIAVATDEDIARVLGIPRLVVSEAIYAPDEDSDFVDLWSDFCWIGYTEVGSNSAAKPSFGYSYRLRGNPVVENGYYDDNSVTWHYPVQDETTPEIVGAEAGFLYSDCLST